MSATDNTASFRWTSALRSHPGRVRAVNEDACLELPQRGIWAVADGMGGHALGEFASRLAVRALSELPALPVLPNASKLEQIVALAREQLLQANQRLRAEAERRDVPVIGTTIAALFAAGRRCTGLWAGDSRIYLHRAGCLRQLTRDHSQLEAVRALHTNAADATLERPPPNLITRALGGADTLELDDVSIEIIDGDVFLLCSDGLSNEVSAAAIEQALLPGNCRQACDLLIEQALAHGGHDNITAVVVHAEDLCSPDRTVILPVM